MKTERLWCVVEHKEEMHVMPTNDSAHHRLFGCWCKPTFDPDSRALSPVWIHHAADKREAKERWLDGSSGELKAGWELD